MTFIFRAAVVAAMLAPVAIAQSAVAQQYPNKPIRMLIPAPPGGGTDILGRILASGITDLWSQIVVVDNRGGASGRIGGAAVAKANPDGYTLLFTYGGVLTTGLPLFRELPFDPIKDFAPVAMMAHVPGILVAHPSFPAKTVAELIKLAKAKPGALNHGAGSIGTTSHLNMELFKQMAGIDMLLISYPGDGPLLIALLGGHVQVSFGNVVSTWPHLQSGRLRPIAVATAQRLANLPEVPTIAESGLPGYEALLFYALFAPAKTPPAIVTKLNQAVQQVRQIPAVKQQLTTLGAIPIDMTPDELGALVRRELAKWTKVIRASGIKAD